jgi:hypothetical protein
VKRATRGELENPDRSVSRQRRQAGQQRRVRMIAATPPGVGIQVRQRQLDAADPDGDARAWGEPP